MKDLALFLSAFLTVFLLVFQQQNVQGRHFVMGTLTSLGIGACQVTLWSLIPGAGVTEIAATLAGGPVGFNVSLWLHPRIIRRRANGA